MGPGRLELLGKDLDPYTLLGTGFNNLELNGNLNGRSVYFEDPALDL
jgi:hypothetical protein